MIMAMKTISGTYIHDVCISAGLGIVEMLVGLLHFYPVYTAGLSD